MLWKTDVNYLDLSGYPADPVLSANDEFEITANADIAALDRFARTVLEINYEFEGGTILRSVTGYQAGSTIYRTDLDGTSAGNNTFRDYVEEDIFSQEINLISPETGRFSWILGLYYQVDEYDFPPGEFVIGVPPGSVFSEYVLQGTNPKNTYAVFGQAAFDLTDRLELEVGARYGFEAQVEAVFGDFSLDAGLGVMESEIGQFFATDPRSATFTACDPNTGPSSVSCINLEGHEQTYAPELTFNLGVQYVFSLPGGDTLTPRLNYGHVSQQWATLFQNPARGDRVEERNIVNAQLAWQHGDFVTTLWATNLTDQHYMGALNTGLRFAGPPRQYGVRVFRAF